MACRTEGEQVIYYNGHLPVFMHARADRRRFLRAQAMSTHVRVYHGSVGPLPAQYVARQKLRLCGTVDHWVNEKNTLTVELHRLGSPL